MTVIRNKGFRPSISAADVTALRGPNDGHVQRTPAAFAAGSTQSSVNSATSRAMRTAFPDAGWRSKWAAARSG